MTHDPPRSPKSRLRPVYTVPEEPPHRTETVIYQLEDTGHPVLRLRPTVRVRLDDGRPSYIYRVDAFSRLSGRHLGEAEVMAPPGGEAEYAAHARQFQSRPFRDVIDRLRAKLVEELRDVEPAGVAQA